jgi:hypothetical protein
MLEAQLGLSEVPSHRRSDQTEVVLDFSTFLGLTLSTASDLTLRLENQTGLDQDGSEDAVRTTAHDLPGPEIRANGIAFIPHSAGSAGLQKGAALTHAAVLRQRMHLAHALQIGTQQS